MKYVFYILIFFFIFSSSVRASEPWWSVQSVDTMKYSRDFSRQVLSNPQQFASLIDSQVHEIADLGATHVALGTPYDREFLPVLKMWVAAARRYHLSVWYRGNFAGWEGWFGYARIARAEHTTLLTSFLDHNGDLFQTGDIFTPCPECENGGPGDPRVTNDVDGFRQFMFDEYDLSRAKFRKMKKVVAVYPNSMNGDVARLIMDRNTTSRLGGLVVIDHYTQTTQQLITDIGNFASTSGGKIVLGEIGAPIPDIHGSMTEEEQRAWLDETLSALAPLPGVVGINYWVSEGGSTALFDSGTKKLAADTLSHYFQPVILSGRVVDTFGVPVADATASTFHKTTYTDRNGEFHIPAIVTPSSTTIVKIGYRDTTTLLHDHATVTLVRDLPPICLWRPWTQSLCLWGQRTFSF